MKLLDKLNTAKEEHNRLKTKYKTVVKEIKEYLKSSYYEKYEDSFRHAICLYYGEFVKEYSMSYLPNNLKLKISTHWDKDLNYQISDNYYDIYKYWGSIIDETSERVGFACELKHLQEALQYEMKNLWLFNVNDNKYTDSFENFKEDPGNLLELFKQFHSKNSNIIELMHHPSLGVKNIVLFIKDV